MHRRFTLVLQKATNEFLCIVVVAFAVVHFHDYVFTVIWNFQEILALHSVMTGGVVCEPQGATKVGKFQVQQIFASRSCWVNWE